jgi:hypothetical protein
MIPRSRIPLLPVLLGILALAACDGPTAPDRLVLEAVEGNAQEALPGERLPQHLGVRVSRPDGTPAQGVAVTFQATAGAGSVQVTTGITDSYGMARAIWKLPAAGGGPFVVTAQAAGAGEPASFTAAWMPRERADLLLSSTGARVRLLLHPTGLMGTPVVFPAEFADSLAITPLPAADSYSEVVAFAEGLPPLVRTDLRWTAGRDTLRLDFPQRVRVPVTIWIIRQPYAASREYIDNQLLSARSIWGKAGIDLDVRVVDATGHPDAGLYQGETQACVNTAVTSIGRDPGRTNVYVTGQPTINGGLYAGFACDAGLIFMTTMPGLGTLLAHELGHTFGLPHAGVGNVMHPGSSGHGLTAGQIFHAHASPLSALQVLYADQAVMPSRTCFPQGTCVELSFDM